VIGVSLEECLRAAYQLIRGQRKGGEGYILQNQALNFSPQTQVKIRLYGIDTPERRQPFGTKAKQFTSDLCFGKTVEVETVDTDRYGRTVALIRSENGKVLKEEILSVGFAWVYERYCMKSICSEWKRLEDEARAVGLGLWKDKDPVPP